MSKFRSPGKGQKTAFPVRKENISAPIPQSDDEEFPIRTPGASIATPLGSETLEKQIGYREPSPEEVEVSKKDPPLQNGLVVSDPVEPEQNTISITSTNERPIHSIPQPAEHLEDVQASAEVAPPVPSTAKPQRKKSSLRSMFGKLFGKKRKGSASSHPRAKDSSEYPVAQHRSDPTAFNRSPPTNTTPTKRSASLPINEFNRALRSHSVAIDDFPLRQSLYDQDNTKQGGITRPRGSTTPSRLWEPGKASRYLDWTGLSPRPASVHGRGSIHVTDAKEDEAVGLALTSGSHPNRRSRSLGELRGGMSESAVRRRSDEIRYWRESYDPGVFSPISSNKAEFDEDPVIDDAPEEEQPQPFNFGQMREMASMKITQAASLETRVMQLEERVLNMERAISRLQITSSSHPIQFQEPPLRNPSRNISAPVTRPTTDNSEMSLPQLQYNHGSPQRQPRQEGTFQGSQIRSSSYGSSRPSTMSNNTYQPSFDTYPPQIFPSANTNMGLSPKPARPLSTSTTIRAVPSSSPTLAKDDRCTLEHLNALQDMIQAEHEARQNLEGVVLSLQRQLHAVLAAQPPIRHKQQVPNEAVSTFDRTDSDDEPETPLNEDFRTPMEENGFEDEIFGSSGHEGALPRRLSLSQITMSKTQQQQRHQPSVNF